MRADLTRGQPPGIQRQDDGIDITQASLPLPHDNGIKTPHPIPRHLNLDRTHRIRQHRLGPDTIARIPTVTTFDSVLLIPQMRGHLLIKSSLQHRLGEQLQQAIRPGQSDTATLSRLHHLPYRGTLRLRRLDLRLLDHLRQSSHILDLVGHQPTFPADTLVHLSGRLHRWLHRPLKPWRPRLSSGLTAVSVQVSG